MFHDEAMQIASRRVNPLAWFAEPIVQCNITLETSCCECYVASHNERMETAMTADATKSEAITKTVTEPGTDAPAETAKTDQTVKAETAAPKAEEKAAPAKAKAAGVAKDAKPAVKKTAQAAPKANKVTKKKIAAGKPVKKAPVSAKKGTTMFNFDTKQWMGGFEMPTADKFEALVAETSKKNEELVKKTQAATEEFAQLAKANIEAMVEAGRIAAQGAKAISSELIEDTREGMEKSADTVKALAEVKSPTEFFQLQSEWMRASFDQMVSESSKLSERLIKLSGDAAQPVTSQASVNAEKVKGLMS